MSLRLTFWAAALAAAMPLCARQAGTTLFVAPTEVTASLRGTPALSRVADALAGEFSARLSAVPGFELVDRTVAYERAADAERGLNEVGAVETRGAEFNRLTGAECVLVPTVTAWSEDSASQDGLVRRSLALTLQARIVDTTTGTVRESVSVTRSAVRAADAVNAASLDRLPETLAAEAAAECVRRLTAALSPASVIDVDGSTVTVNRGLGFFEVGSTATLFTKSRTVTDPESGESIRIRGRPSGKIRIVYAEAGYCQGELLEGGRAEVGGNAVPDAVGE